MNMDSINNPPQSNTPNVSQPETQPKTSWKSANARVVIPTQVKIGSREVSIEKPTAQIDRSHIQPNGQNEINQPSKETLSTMFKSLFKSLKNAAAKLFKTDSNKIKEMRTSEKDETFNKPSVTKKEVKEGLQELLNEKESPPAETMAKAPTESTARGGLLTPITLQLKQKVRDLEAQLNKNLENASFMGLGAVLEQNKGLEKLRNELFKLKDEIRSNLRQDILLINSWMKRDNISEEEFHQLNAQLASINSQIDAITEQIGKTSPKPTKA